MPRNDQAKSLERAMCDKMAVQQIAAILFGRNYTLAVAESVTAGTLQTAFVAAENASAFFQGGITIYNAKQKYTHLKVDIVHALVCNSVSETVAVEMALGVSKSFLSDWGIGITGYASPLPGHDMNPLYAWFAISFRNEIVQSQIITSEIMDPLQVQLKYVNAVLNAFCKHLTSGSQL